MEKWPCDQCDMVLTTKHNLNYHIAAKHGEKKIMCDKCDYKTVSKVNLKEHIRYYHEDFMFKCKECDFTCKGKTSLHNHKVKVHMVRYFYFLLAKVWVKRLANYFQMASYVIKTQNR